MNTKFILLFSILLLISSCNEVVQHKPIKTNKQTNSIKYAKGFSIQTYASYKKLTILTSFQGDNSKHDYFLFRKGTTIPDTLKGKNTIHVPIKKIVVTSTTHIPMLEILEMENTLVGFPNTRYVSSKKTRRLIDTNQIQELGKEQSINTEILIELQPELVVGFGVNTTSKVFENIQNMGIPVIMNSDWLEQTPLGRAEWIRFFGALYDKDSLAYEKFSTIANNYNTIKNKVSKIKHTPSVISGSLFQDVWHVPAGKSFMANYLKDAKTNYLWSNTKGTGSLPLSLEVVLDKGKDADFWIAPGFFTTRKAMLQASEHYSQFSAYQQDNIFSYAARKGATGGIIYFELATARPDLVLQDMVKIFHPDIFPDYTMTFYNKVE
jgi:iron complex transport system substrate-binding protein